MSDVPVYRLDRLSSTGFATYGQLIDAASEQRVCVTLELPWHDNAHDLSCIPIGIYPAHRRLSPKRGYELFELEAVPDRSNIEMHVGNLPHDSLGCILLGTHFGAVNGQSGVLESKVAFTEWMFRNRGHDHIQLVITDHLEPKALV